MAKESRSYQEIPETPHSVFWVELEGDRNEFNGLAEDLTTNKVLYKGKYAYPPMASAFPPIPMYFEIIAAVGSLVTIADIFYRYLKDKKDDKERKVTFNFGGKELTIHGNYSKEEILFILQNFSKQATSQQMSAISETRKSELKAELVELKRLQKTYQRLVGVGEGEEKPNKEWLAKLNEYRDEKAKVDFKIRRIEDLLKE
jgi:hypothetical protein